MNYSEIMAKAAYEAMMVLNESREVVAMNDTARALFNGEGGLGVPLADVIGGSDLDAMVQYALENGESEFEVQATIHGRFYRVRTRLVDENGDSFIGLALQDVTELVRLNRARRDMVSNISHELRTPVANIRMIIDSLFHDVDKPKRKQSIASLKSVARETDALEWLVQEMLDLSMIESGQAIVRMVDADVHPLVESVLERMLDQAESRGLALENNVDEGVVALCDPDLIRRVIINLVHNSMKYSPKGGTVSVTAYPEGEDIVIQVDDEGPGVSLDQVERVFERFYQVDSSRSKKEGSGLGLAICKHILEAHAGRIWAISNEEAPGGRFAFNLANPRV